jgi:MATE family multidrug resistance protein
MRMLSVNSDILIRTGSLIAVWLFFAAQGARAGDVALAANSVLNNFLSGQRLLPRWFRQCRPATLRPRPVAPATKPDFSGAVRAVLIWVPAFSVAVAGHHCAVSAAPDRHHDRKWRCASALHADYLPFVVFAPSARRVRLFPLTAFISCDLGARHAQSDAAVASDLPWRVVFAAIVWLCRPCGARSWCNYAARGASRRYAIRALFRASFATDAATSPANPRP